METTTKSEKVKQIPTPVVRIKEIPNYVPLQNFRFPPGYIKYWGKTYDEEKTHVYYDLDDSDFEWLQNFNKNSQDQKLTEDEFELGIDRFEKATGFSTELVSISKAMQSIPQSLRDSKPKAMKKLYWYWKKKRLERISKQYPTCGKPLLEQFEIEPDPNDLNPNVAFRPREKEKPIRKVFIITNY